MYNLPRFGKAVPIMFLPGLRGDFIFDIIGSPEDRKEYPPLSEAESWLPASSIDYRYVSVTGSWELNRTSTDWKTAMFRAANIPQESPDDLGPGTIWYSRAMRPEDLQRALEEAHKHVAVSLMYSQQQDRAAAWQHPNLTLAEPWLELGIVSQASVPPLPVLVMLIPWALGCSGLGLAYSFRGRWDSYFAVRSLYWGCKTIAKVDVMEVMRA
jgi:hypothetical protein